MSADRLPKIIMTIVQNKIRYRQYWASTGVSSYHEDFQLIADMGCDRWSGPRYGSQQQVPFD